MSRNKDASIFLIFLITFLPAAGVRKENRSCWTPVCPPAWCWALELPWDEGPPGQAHADLIHRDL